MAAPGGGSARDDFAMMRPAAIEAARAGRCLVTGWLSRGNGAPLELITTIGPAITGPAPSARRAEPGPGGLRIGEAPSLWPGAPGAGRGRHAALGRNGLDTPAAAADAGPDAGPAVGPDAGPAVGPDAGPAAGPAGGLTAGLLTLTEEVPFPEPLLFPAGAWGVPAGGGCFGDLDQLVWVPCPGYPVTPSRAAEPAPGASEPGLFEAALVALMRRPFGWLLVAEPTDLMAAEMAELRTELDILSRHRGQHTVAAVERTERRLAELSDFAEAGLWRARVLAGASSPDELGVLAPLLAGAADLAFYPYRLRSAPGARSLAEALSGQMQDAMDGAQSPFFVTAGMLTALAGLPRLGVPGLSVPGPSRAGQVGRPSGGGSAAHHGDGAARNGAVPTWPVPAAPARPGTAVPEPHGQNGTASPGRAPAATIDLGAGLDDGEAFTVPLAALGRGVLVAGSAGTGKSGTVRNLLGQLTSAGVPWLAVGPAGHGHAAGLAAAGVTVVNPCDPGAVPLTVSPFAPEPGYPVLAHIALVGSLLDAAFDADEPFSLITAQALRRVYEAAGWDLVTGRAAPGTVAAPPVPDLGQVHAAIIDAAGQAGYGRLTRARLRGRADARFGSLRAGSAGRFIEGGHPAGIGGLLSRDVVLALHDVGTEDDRALIAGALLIRVAEHLRVRARAGPGAGPRHVTVIEEARGLLRDRGPGHPVSRAAERFAALLAEMASYGAGTVITERSPARLVADAVQNTGIRIVHRLPGRADQEAATGTADAPGRPPGPATPARQLALAEPGVAMVLADGLDGPAWVRAPADTHAGAVAQPGTGDVTVLLGGRRSAACGRHCREVRACDLSGLHLAETRAESAEDAWLRVWTGTFVLAFLTGNPLPAVPGPLSRRWRGLGVRPRECLLARVADAVVGGRAAALRTSFDPGRFTGIVTSAALTRLNDAANAARAAGVAGPAIRPGPVWVIPQLRWLHEAERLSPLSGPALAPADQAPPLDFDLAGLPDWPGIQAGQRARALRRHPLSMDQAANRRLAWIAVATEDGPAALAADLAQAAAGAEPAEQLRHAAGLMAVSGPRTGAGAGPGWLEVVLSWPRRFIMSSAHSCRPGDAADCLPG